MTLIWERNHLQLGVNYPATTERSVEMICDKRNSCLWLVSQI